MALFSLRGRVISRCGYIFETGSAPMELLLIVEFAYNTHPPVSSKKQGALIDGSQHLLVPGMCKRPGASVVEEAISVRKYLGEFSVESSG
jgi:hypothetical protein